MLVHRGLRTQSGRGIGSIFSALARGLAPIAKLGLRAGKSFLSNPFCTKSWQISIRLGKRIRC